MTLDSLTTLKHLCGKGLNYVSLMSINITFIYYFYAWNVSKQVLKQMNFRAN